MKRNIIAVIAALALSTTTVFAMPVNEHLNQNVNAETTVISDNVSEVIRLVNEERTKAGLPAVQYNAALAASAQIRANEITKNFSHTRPDGRKWFTAINDCGVKYSCVAENLAWGQFTPESVVKAWMSSPTHRAAILNSRYTNTGIGIVNNNGICYWSECFTY